APRPPRPVGRDARPHRGALLRRLDPVAHARDREPDPRPARAAARVAHLDPPGGHMSPGEVGLRRTNASISVDGTPLPARVFDDLLEMRVARGTRTIGRASLVLADRTFSLAENHLRIGSEVKISALEPAVELFGGVVTSLATDIDRDGPRVLVTAHDKSHVMARTRTTKTYAELSAKDIVEQLAGEHRLRAEVTDSRAGKVKETWFWR